MRPSRLPRMNGRACITFILVLLPATGWSQQERAKGTVTGHVLCADVNLPARLAQMWLLPLRKPQVHGSEQKPDGMEQVAAQSKIDGSFVFPRVAPGEYYVSVTYSGYATPESWFPHEKLRKPTAEEYEEIVKTLSTVVVVANKTVNVEVLLQRGGSISGTVRYDDGSLAHVGIDVLRRDTAGKWTDTFTRGTTDDLGHFRIAGIPPGEYTLSIGLSAQDSSGNWSRGTLNVYFGDVFLPRDAKSFKVGEGEESVGDDVVIRLSKLHSVTGSLIDASGRAINSGDVTILTAPDVTEVLRTHVEAEDSTFHFDFVPEGHYILRVTNARNVTRETLLPPAGFVPIPTLKETPLQSFGNYEVPLEVLSDLPNLNLMIPSKDK
jgi:hypothetical protein